MIGLGTGWRLIFYLHKRSSIIRFLARGIWLGYFNICSILLSLLIAKHPTAPGLVVVITVTSAHPKSHREHVGRDRLTCSQDMLQ